MQLQSNIPHLRWDRSCLVQTWHLHRCGATRFKEQTGDGMLEVSRSYMQLFKGM